jgi:stage II sporulation protein R
MCRPALILLLAALAGWIWPVGAPAVGVQVARPHSGRLIRFHVVANSDAPRDQAVKLAVRDALLAQLQPLLRRAASRGQAWHLLEEDRAGLRRTADTVLTSYRVGYRAGVVLGTARFPAKAYGGLLLPAGRYPSLRVVLGRGRGHNWWCVLFPPLCLVNASSAVGHSEPLPSKPGRTAPTIPRLLSRIWHGIDRELHRLFPH